MLNHDRKINVYFNLHKRLFSVTQGGIVQFHSDALTVVDSKFLVGKAGQLKVRNTGRKNVHAKVSGYLADFMTANTIPYLIQADSFRKAYYNPYDVDTFVDYADRIPVHAADVVRLSIKDGIPSIHYANQEL